MQYSEIHLGFSTADAQSVAVHFEGGDLIVKFDDWQERAVEARFEDVLGFAWNAEQVATGVRDDSTYEVMESTWLAEQAGLAGVQLAGYAHYKLCFNPWGALDVIAKRRQAV